MKGLQLAKQLGKRAYLVNSVWPRRGMAQLSLGGTAEQEELSIGIAGLARRGARRLDRTPALRALRRIVAGPPTGWSHVVRSLRGAAVYATGQHHGVYAACRAQVPFAFTRLYNHKIRGLLEWAGVEVPIAHTLDEVVACMRWAKANGDVFERLFHWMEQQPTWPGLSATRGRSPAQS